MTRSDAVLAANRLTAAWAARHEAGPTVLSGIGVWALLAALEAGAAGPALAELEGAVGLAPDEALAALAEAVGLLDESDAVRTALGLWFVDEVAVEPTWLDALPATSFSRLTGVPDDDQAALDAWANGCTDGEIERMPVQVDAETKAVLASALLVRTNWVKPFVDWRTAFDDGPWADVEASVLYRTTEQLGDVLVADRGTGPVTMVRVEGTDDIDVWLLVGGPDAPPETVLADGLDALGSLDDAVPGDELPVGGPGPGIEVKVVESSVAADQLVLRTVGFDVRASHDLLEHADVFGLRAATEVVPGHFPGISTYPLAIQQARQEASATFSAEGFVAAAVTALSMLAGSAAPPQTFEVRRVTVIIDRPFGFAAVHRPSELVLATGWVTEPAAPTPYA